MNADGPSAQLLTLMFMPQTISILPISFLFFNPLQSPPLTTDVHCLPQNRSFVGLSSSPNALKKVTHLRELKAQVALCNEQFYGASQNVRTCCTNMKRM